MSYITSTTVLKPSVQVLINNKVIDTYSHQGKTFIEGRPDSTYTIRVRNNDWRRVAAVISVDGLSVIDGKTAGPTSEKYVINGHDFIDIKGWRINDNEIREFKFGSRRASYNQRSGEGQATDIGVIGVLTYAEVVNYVAPQPRYLYQPIFNHGYGINTVGVNAVGSFAGHAGDSTIGMNTLACSATMDSSPLRSRRITADSAFMAAKSLNNVGTSQGDLAESRVKHVDFNTDMSSFITEAIYYDDVKGLEARGIKVRRGVRDPNPFPGLNQTYCKDL